MLRAVTHEQVTRFVSEVVRPDLLTLVISGSFDRAAMLRATEVLLRDVPAAGPLGPRPTVAGPVAPARRLTLVDVPGALQATVMFASAMTPAGSEDWATQRVLGELFGGSFSSRLNMLLRERYGLTYGFGARFGGGLRQDTLSGDGAVVRERAAEAVKALVDEASRLARGEVDGPEVDAARDRQIKHLEGSFETPTEAASLVADALRLGGGPGELRQRVERLRSVDLAAVRRLAPARIDPSRLQFVVAGDAASLEAPLRALSLGPLDVIRRPVAVSQPAPSTTVQP